MSAEAIGCVVAVVGCVVGVLGLIYGRDKKISKDAEWKGAVNTKLDSIQSGVSGIGERMAKVEGAVAIHDTQIAIIKEKIGLDEKETA